MFTDAAVAEIIYETIIKIWKLYVCVAYSAKKLCDSSQFQNCKVIFIWEFDTLKIINSYKRQLICFLISFHFMETITFGSL